VLRLGITLPQFRADAAPALAVAAAAEVAGLDGVFVFDHMWPLGSPQRPALHGTTLLGALAAETDRIAVGTLVARVGLIDDSLLIQKLSTLNHIAGDRLIAGLGTGDRANRAENEAYGVPYPPATERLARLKACVEELRNAGVSTWVGGRSEAVRRTAAGADGWNCWGADPATFTSEGATVIETAKEAARSEGRSGTGSRSEGRSGTGSRSEGRSGPGSRSEGRSGPGSRSEGRSGPGVPELTWGGQVLIGRNAREAAEKLRRYGTRPGLVHGTVDDLRRHLAALTAAGATWAVCAPLDVGDDPDVTQTLALATGGSLA